LLAGNIHVENLRLAGRRSPLLGSRWRAQGAPLRYARAARGYSALTAPTANLGSQLSTARRKVLDDGVRRRYSRTLIDGCYSQLPFASPDAKQTNRRPQATIRFSFMFHFPGRSVRDAKARELRL